MGIVDRFLKYWKQRASPQQQETASVVNQAPLFVEAYDAFGRMVTVPRDEWREKVLFPQLRHNWDLPDALFMNTVTALGDGFASEIIPAAERLVALYPDRDEYVTALGQAYLKLSRFDDAQSLYENHLATHDQNGAMLVGLALAYNALDKPDLTEQTLWHALQVDPNHVIGVGWFLARERNRHGDSGYVPTLNKLAALPGSWRAKRLLAVKALDEGLAEDAYALYSRVINAERDNGDALAFVAGDLVQRGQPELALDLVAPSYKPERHGASAGFALLEAYLSTRKPRQAAILLHDLFMLHHPPIQARLVDAARRLDALKDETAQRTRQPAGDVDMRHLLVHSPIFMFGFNGVPRWMLPPKSPISKRVTMLPFSRILNAQEVTGLVPETNAGRFTRSLPLYLMESMILRTDAIAVFLLAAVVGVGPAIHGAVVDEATLRAMNIPASQPSDIIVTGTVEIVDEQYCVTVTAWDASAYSVIANIQRVVPEATYGESIHSIESELIEALGLMDTQTPDPYLGSALGAPIPDECMLVYLSAIGQAVSLLLINEGYVEIDAMWGERSIIAAPLELALQYPQLEVARVFFLSNLWLDKDAQSDTCAEFRLQTLALLEQAGPRTTFHLLSPLVYKLLDMGGEYERRKQELSRAADGEYAAWLNRI